MHDVESINYPLSCLWYDLWQLIRPYKWRFYAATLLRATSDIVWLYPGIALAQIVNFFTTYQIGDSLEPLMPIALLWVAASIYRYAAQEACKFIGYQVSERTALDAQLAAYQQLFCIDIAWHETVSSGAKMKRIQRGAKAIDDIIRMWIDTFIEALVRFIGAIVILSSFDVRIGWLMILFITLYYSLSLSLTRWAVKAANAANIEEERLSGTGFEGINNIRSVKVLGMSVPLMGIVQSQAKTLFAKIRERIFRFRTRAGVLHGLFQLFRLGSLFFVGWLIVHDQADVGLLILAFDYFTHVAISADEISEKTHKLVVAQYEIGRMQAMFDAPVSIDIKKGMQQFPKEWSKITLKDVEFSYGTTDVLRNVSLTIHTGEKVGIVGVSGAGKSTLFKLLLKEHEDYTGDILIDDVPLRTIKRSSFSDHTAVVLQETEVFNFSLRDNIALANWKYRNDDKRLKQAAKIAHVTDFMKRLPEGFETKIGEKGVKLSGGEKQRVGIARAVFKEPEILFLDEATSHLDSESEAKIQDSLHTFFESVTAVVIAHRLSTIREMDTIYVLEDGRIVESGSFSDLLKQKGRFAQMWKRQQF